MTQVITTRDQIERFALLTLRQRMKLELLGMTHSGGSTMSLINKKYGTTFRRKQDALDYINSKLETTT